MFDKLVKDYEHRLYLIVAEAIKNISAFKDLSWGRLKSVVDSVQQISLVNKQFVYQEGDAVEYVYFVRSG